MREFIEFETLLDHGYFFVVELGVPLTVVFAPYAHVQIVDFIVIAFWVAQW